MLRFAVMAGPGKRWPICVLGYLHKRLGEAELREIYGTAGA